MDENPYQAPSVANDPVGRPNPVGRAPMIWAIIGFAIGTLAAAPFILSNETQIRLAGGAICGGPLGALFGLAHGIHRRRQANSDAI